MWWWWWQWSKSHFTWIYGLWCKSLCSMVLLTREQLWRVVMTIPRLLEQVLFVKTRDERESEPHWDNCEWIGGDTKAWQATCQGGGGLGWEGDRCRGMEKGGYDVLVVVTISLRYHVMHLTFLCRLTMPALSYTSPVSPLYRGKPVLTFFFYLQTPSSKTYVEQILLDFYHFQKLCQSCSFSLFWPSVPKLRFHLQERFALGGIVKDATKTPKVRMGALIERKNWNNNLYCFFYWSTSSQIDDI